MRILSSFLVVVSTGVLLATTTDAFRVATSSPARSVRQQHDAVQLQMSSSSSSSQEERLGLRARVWNKAIKQPVVGVWNKVVTSRSAASDVSSTVNKNRRPRRSIAALSLTTTLTMLTTILASPAASHAKAAAAKAVAVAAVAASPKPALKILPAGMLFAAVTGASVIVGKAVLKRTTGSSDDDDDGSSVVAATITQEEEEAEKTEAVAVATEEEEVTIEATVEDTEATTAEEEEFDGQKWAEEVLERQKEAEATLADALADAATATTTTEPSASGLQQPAPAEEVLETDGELTVATAVETATEVETEEEIVSHGYKNGRVAPPKVIDPTPPAEKQQPEEPKKEVRDQPLSPEEEAILASKYGQIENVAERCFQILEDLGLAEEPPVVEEEEEGEEPAATVEVAATVVKTAAKAEPVVSNGHASPKVVEPPTVVPEPAVEKKSVWDTFVGAVSGGERQEEKKADAPQFVRKQPLPGFLEAKLKAKYGRIDDVSEKCCKILDDLELLKDAYP
mmetsp:Transcript_42958/g.63738  ORF Transcript_42958/g.63738 Transcript_42958/m.63738 type:complete len:511 (+) Transcript_42958:177-1709(+)